MTTLAAMLTGWVRLAVCQPLAVSLVKVTLASRLPPAVHRLPSMGAGILGAFIEPYSRDIAGVADS
jgi:hypothetical protein